MPTITAAEAASLNDPTVTQRVARCTVCGHTTVVLPYGVSVTPLCLECGPGCGLVITPAVTADDLDRILLTAQANTGQDIAEIERATADMAPDDWRRGELLGLLTIMRATYDRIASTDVR